MRKGRVEEKYHFFVDRVQIPSVSEKPVKSLGKVFDSTLKDRAAVKATHKELKPGYQQLTSQDCQGSPRYGFISMVSCQDYCGHC